ncbi:MAG: thioredoxin domain-containing protein [Elusimicrobiota bacterium]
MSPNRLASEKSPYLLQHKDNPVDWRPWGEASFRAAKEQDKPLLLSVGYSTCHWCHVMERESFSNAAVAEVMNKNFICVKLDREERPDVDKVYMTAVQAMTGQGGWPLNVFLTPELKPFFGGTYFPPTARWGQPGWIQLLGRIAELWATRRKDIESDAARLSSEVARHVAASGDERLKPAAKLLDDAMTAFRGAFDPENSGFGGAPKFPMPSYQRFLLRRHARTGDGDARAMAIESLRAMARGGIFDQVGGGFARYSTDGEWRVPHFEKMLYDNAQLLENLADALLVSRDAELDRALRRTVAYLKRDLRGPKGGFFSAEDADSLPPELAGRACDDNHEHKEEGSFYLWTKKELETALGPDAKAFCARYGVEDDGNAPADPHGEFEGKNILFDKSPDAMPETAAVAALSKLLKIRSQRPRPSLDDKCLASWNGLALTGLSRASIATGDPEILTLALSAAEFLLHECASEDGKSLYHRWREGERAISGFADDYAFVAAGFLDLYEASFEPRWLSWSLQFAEGSISRFGAPGGGLFQTAAGEAAELFARSVEDHDGVEPAASSVMTETALRLYELTGRDSLRRFADETLERFGARASNNKLSMSYYLCALERALGVPKTLIIAGLDLPGGRELLAAARSKLRPDVSVAAFSKKTKKELSALLPAVAAMPESGTAAAYVCIGRACGLPISDPSALTARLDSK